MMTKGMVRLLLPNFMPQLKSTPGPWTFKRAHVNDFSKSRDVESWEDNDWPEWTSKVGTTQITQDCPTLRLASHHGILYLNLIKNMLNTCIYAHIYTSIHLSIQSWHHSSQNTYLSIYPNKRELNILKKP